MTTITDTDISRARDVSPPRADDLRIEPTYDHAVSNFRERIDDNISLLMSCWRQGTPIEAPKREYDWARLYEGPLVDTAFAMFVVDTRDQRHTPDGLITTVWPEHWLDSYTKLDE